MTAGKSAAWFSYDPHGDGMEFHPTAEDAKKCADAALEMERTWADDGWNDDVGDICWGRIYERTVETERRPVTDDDAVNRASVDEFVDYALCPVHAAEEDPTPKLLEEHLKLKALLRAARALQSECMEQHGHQWCAHRASLHAAAVACADIPTEES